jgi:mercuric ion transport protein
MSHTQPSVVRGGEGEDTLAVTGPAAGGLAGSFAAGFAALCCAGPSVAALLGAGGVAASTALNPYRPVLLGASFALIAFGFWQVYARRRVGPDSQACRIRSARGTRMLLWASALAWLAAAVIPPLFNLESGG